MVFSMYHFSENRYMTDVLHRAVFNSAGGMVETYIQKSADGVYYLYECESQNKLGYIDFDIIQKNFSNLIFINDMENSCLHLDYHGIGSLLHEFVFYVAAQTRKCNGLQLTVAYQSHLFHYKCGFRFKNDLDNLVLEKMTQQLEQDPGIKKTTLRHLPQSMYMPEGTLRNKVEEYNHHRISDILKHPNR